jgi:hypothetical protein
VIPGRYCPCGWRVGDADHDHEERLAGVAADEADARFDADLAERGR